MASAPVKIVSLFEESVRKELFNGVRLARTDIEDQEVMPPDNIQENLGPSEEGALQPKVHQVSDRRMCSSCNVVFSSREEQVLHYKLDWHRFNLKQRIMGAEPVSEEKFETISGDVSSISGSDTEEEDSDKGTETLRTASPTHGKAKTSADAEENTDAKDGRGRRSAKVFFKNGTGEIFSVYRCLLHGKKDAPDSEDDLVSIATTLPTLANWTILMIAGGHFAGAVFNKSELVVHKTFHRYTVRAKRGTAQGARDSKQGGSHPKSAGANLRRYNEAALNEDIRQLLVSWSDHLKSSHKIFVRAPSYNKATFFGGKDAPLDRTDSKVVTVPFATRRPTLKEVTRVHEELSTIECYGRESPKRLQNAKKKAETNDTGSESDGKQTRRPKSGGGKQKKGQQADGMEDEDCGRDKNRGPKQPDPECLGSSSDDNQDALILESSLEVIDTIAALKETGGTKKRKPRNRKKKEDKGAKVTDRTKDMAVGEESARQVAGTSDFGTADMEKEIKRLEKELAERQLRNALFTCCKAGNAESLQKLLKHLIVSNNAINGGDLTTSTSEQQHQLQGDSANASTLDNTSLNQDDMQSLPQKSTSDDHETPQDKDTGSSSTCISDKTETEHGTTLPGAVCEVTPDMLVEALDDHGSTLLHVVARAGSKAVISLLMAAGADPSLKDKKGRPPYVVCSSKEVRNEFRRFMAENPGKYDYVKAQIPAPLTEEMEQTRAAKQAEKRKAQKIAKKKRDQEEREERMKREKEEAEKTRFSSLSDREKRALAAERRLAQQGQNTTGLSNANRCWFCGEALFGKVPFEYQDFKFCTMKCLKVHKKNATSGNS
ncbi:ANKZF1 [Branchiostoma lanceolatum]|uniref:ANKZF1 protein n=1 Tax=Branchiostoma lanceolatum TaxID=7740 RepID=A0A8J9YRW8_BRALA|nr:ANKZF1 [Branchiostoma lanceolatum]